MSHRHLTLVISDLLPHLLHESELKTPGLNKLLARAESMTCHNPTFEALLFQLFSLPLSQQLPIAAITGLADELETSEDYWFRMDPVELQVDLAGIYLLGNEYLTDTIEHTKLTTLLALDNIIFYSPHPKRWYLKLKNDPEIQTYLLSQVIGKEISPYLPYGKNQNYWRKLMTEIQILMHGLQFEQNHSIHKGVWLWGGGRMPIFSGKNRWQSIYTNDVLAQGLAKLCKIDSFDLPHVPLDLQLQEGEHLIIINHPDNKTLDEKWFMPLVKILSKKQINSLDLYLGDDRVYRITSRTIHYFWRRKKPIKNHEKTYRSPHIT